MNPEISRRAALGLGVAAGASVLLGSSTAFAAEEKRRVIVWSEGTEPKKTYPDGIRAAVAEALKPLEGWEISTRTLTDPNQGVTEEDLAKTDVLFWWGHQKHREVKQELIDAIDKNVRERGMGFVALHSSHFAEPYKKLMGTPCSWTHYTDDGVPVEMLLQKPIQRGGRRGGGSQSAIPALSKGVGNFTIPKMERYGEVFKCKEPSECVYWGVYTLPDGTKEPSRMMLDWKIGNGKVVYFQPGHETYPIFFQKEVQQLMRNCAEWCAPARTTTG
jgi:trehalose utilization protein